MGLLDKLNNLGTRPLFNIGLGLMQAGAPSRDPRASSPWGAGISQGLLAANRNRYAQQMTERQKQQMELEQQKYEMEMRQQERAEAQRQLLADWVKTQPPEVQAMAAVNPGMFFEEAVKAKFAKQPEQWSEPYEITVGGKPVLVKKNKSTGEVKAIGSGPAVEINQGAAPPYQLPSGYMMKNPENPAEGVVPIPGGPGVKPTEGEALKSAQREIALRNLDRLQELYDSRSFDVGMLEGNALKIRARTGPIRMAGIGLSEQEAEAYALIEKLSNDLLAAMRGAQVGPAEQVKFEKQLPRLGQSDEVFKQNLKATRENLMQLQQMISEMRMGGQPKESQNAAPEVKGGNYLEAYGLPGPQ